MIGERQPLIELGKLRFRNDKLRMDGSTLRVLRGNAAEINQRMFFAGGLRVEVDSESYGKKFDVGIKLHRPDGMEPINVVEASWVKVGSPVRDGLMREWYVRMMDAGVNQDSESFVKTYLEVLLAKDIVPNAGSIYGIFGVARREPLLRKALDSLASLALKAHDLRGFSHLSSMELTDQSVAAEFAVQYWNVMPFLSRKRGWIREGLMRPQDVGRSADELEFE